MDALKNMISNVPDWLKRLDELGDQIDQRQIELAAFGAESSAKSIKNKGSTESLRPKNEPAKVDTPPADEVPSAGTDAPRTAAAAAAAKTPPRDEQSPNDEPSSPSSGTPSALQKQTKQAMAKAQRRAREVVKKRHRTESMVSAEEGTPAKYRTRSMVIVYYDSYVQTFFEELVKFVSASRNLMRKAKMTAKVAQYRRLAELDAPSKDEDGDDSGALKPDKSLDAGAASETLPSLRYNSTRRLGPSGRGSGPLHTRGGRGGREVVDSAPNAYDALDKGLEYVQGMCEHAAHQFLRDGDCTEEIANIQRQLAETKEQAAREMERIEREEPELLKAAAETNKVRTHRPPSMRRELTPAKDSNPPLAPKTLEVDPELEAKTKTLVAATIEADEPKLLQATDAPIEADDEGVDDIEIALPPRLNYRSTRAMRG